MSSVLAPSRAALMAAAKPRARAIVNCVAASSARGLAMHLDGMDPETAALVLVLAEAADHGRLARVCAVADDGRPDPGLAAAAAARRERDRLRKQTARAAKAEAAAGARAAAVAERAAELAAEKRDRRDREATRLLAPESTQSAGQALPGVSTRAAA